MFVAKLATRILRYRQPAVEIFRHVHYLSVSDAACQHLEINNVFSHGPCIYGKGVFLRNLLRKCLDKDAGI